MNNIETIKLKNGLTIYLLEEKRRHSTFFELVTYCGGQTKDFNHNKKEYHLQDGVAHILEHYIVECNNQGNFIEILGQEQMSSNAATTRKTTTFFFETVEKVSYGINTLLKSIYDVSFKEEKLKKIKNPIVQEIREKLDSKFYHLNRMKTKNLWKNTSYCDIGGTVEEIEKTTIKDLELLYNAFYHPKNQFIAIAGNFNKKEVLDTINQFYDSIQLKDYNTEVIKQKDSLEVLKKEDSFEFDTPEEFIDVTYKIDISNYSNIERLDLHFYIESFLESSFSITSPLYQKCIKDQIILEPLGINISLFDYYLIVSIGGFTSNREELKKRILEEMIHKENFNEEKFNLNKTNAKIGLILRDENIFKMIGPFLKNVINFNYPYIDKIEDIERLNFKDLKKYVNKLDMTHYTITSIIKK